MSFFTKMKELKWPESVVVPVTREDVLTAHRVKHSTVRWAEFVPDEVPRRLVVTFTAKRQGKFYACTASAALTAGQSRDECLRAVMQKLHDASTTAT